MRLAHANRTKTSEKSAHQQQQHDKKKRKRNYERRRYLWTVGGGGSPFTKQPPEVQFKQRWKFKDTKATKERSQGKKIIKRPRKTGEKGAFLFFKFFSSSNFRLRSWQRRARSLEGRLKGCSTLCHLPPPLPPPPQPPPPSRKQNSALYRLSKREKKEATRTLLFFRCLDNFLLKKNVKFLERIIIPVYITFLRALMCVFSSRVNYVCISIQITLNGNKEDRS